MGSAMLHLLKLYTRMSSLVSHGDLTCREAYTYVAFQLRPDKRLMNVYLYRCECFCVSCKGRISFGCDSSYVFRPPQVRSKNHSKIFKMIN